MARVAEIGFKEMEFAGYFGRSPAQVRQTLDQNGMSSPAAHIQLQALQDDLEGEVERAAILGQKYHRGTLFFQRTNAVSRTISVPPII